MTTPASELHFDDSLSPSHDVLNVSTTAPFDWIRLGFNDFRRIPGLSLLYGFLFAGFCAGVYLLISNAPWFSVAYLTGLVVIGPFVASGLYVASRDMERDVAPSIDRSLSLLMRRSTHLALFSLTLALVMAAWVRFSALLFAVKFSTLSPSIEAYTSLFSSSDGWITLSFFIGIGFILALVVFVLSAVAIPLILDQDAGFISAMQTSYRAVTASPAAMLVWAAIIVAFTAIGIFTAFLGFAVVFPILGYATWHSYRAMVK